MPIQVDCQCGKKLNVKEEAAGKRVRCPACQQVFTVPSLQVEEPLPDAAMEDEAVPLPRRKKKKKRLAQKKSKVLLYAALGTGALLLFCCFPVSGVGVWFFLLRNTPEKTIIGKWQLEAKSMADQVERVAGKKMTDAERKKFEAMFENAIQMEIRDDYTGSMSMSAALAKSQAKSAKVTWTVLKSDSKVITIEWKPVQVSDGSPEKLEITVIDSNHIKIIPQDSQKRGQGDLYLKRSK